MSHRGVYRPLPNIANKEAAADKVEQTTPNGSGQQAAQSHPANGPSFFLNLGDVIYGNFKKALYANNFYRPNASYLHPTPGFDGIILILLNA